MKILKQRRGILECIYTPKSELYKRVNYTRHILLTGLLKSTTETSLLVIGFNLIFYGMVEPSQFRDYVIPIGIIAIMSSVLVDFVGDHVKMVKKDEQFQLTEKMMDEKIQEKAVTEKKAREIAKKLVDKELEDLEDTLCNDPESLCNDKKEKE
jgi:hypothetical protein